jgi:hypothetical protein
MQDPGFDPQHHRWEEGISTLDLANWLKIKTSFACSDIFWILSIN